MIAIGIPSYNEADNISQLVTKVDEAARQLDIAIIIINADNNSPDMTAAVFKQTKTRATKVSLLTKDKGKGVNIRAIFRWIEAHDEVTGCMLIDGDVTSFETTWLSLFAKELERGSDYIVPQYSRNYQEGNTTNHFVYPLIGMHFNGKTPRQPISGDFGVSRRFAKYLIQQQWHDYTWGYGIDIFMTLHALYESFNVVEVSLDRKVHKPSFDKMIPMFVEVAASYYATIDLLQNATIRVPQLTLTKDIPQLITAAPIPSAKITERRRVAQKLYTENRERSCVPELDDLFSEKLDAAVWARVLIAHEVKIGITDPLVLAESILPWYLMRVVNYLQTNDSPSTAAKEIDRQFQSIVELWQHEAHPY